MAPTSLKRAPSLMPGVEEPTSAPASTPPPMSKPEGDVSPEELALCQEGGYHPPGLSPLGSDDINIPPVEDVYGPGPMPTGTLLDLTALESLQVSISHTLATGEVHYHLHSQSITRMSLPSTSSQEQLEPSPKIEEL